MVDTDRTGTLHVHRAERADALADALGELLAVPLPDPFTTEVVAVAAKGMERWLAQRLSHRLGGGPTNETSAGAVGQDGVCANVAFPAPAELVTHAVGIDPQTDPWQPGEAVWPLLEVIDAAAGEPWCTTLGAHLGVSDADPARRTRRFGVARRLADLFASYAVHRPELLAAWRVGDDGDVPADLRWQPELWRRLRARLGGPDPAQRWQAACAALLDDPGRAALPARVSVFGPTRLPAAHLTVLGALARHREVHLWLPHPSPGLWRRPVRTGSLRRRDAATDDHESATAARHPLLASLGRDVHELQQRLAAVDGGTVEHHHPGAEPPATLLGLLQRDLGEDRPPTGATTVLARDDRSVTVHACHGAHRQVEVLREAVLGLLARDDTLEPRDILVMCPDIEAFAPLISAAFGVGTGQSDTRHPAGTAHPAHRLQVRLADRALRQVNPLLDTVAQLLELADARLTATEVLDLAGSGPVRRRFRLADDELDRLRELVTGSGVRWGLDAAHRAPFGLDRFPQNTWSAGLDRMSLGVAMSADEGDWLGTAVALDVDSGDVDLVGRFTELVERLGAVLAALGSGEQPLPAWVDALTGALDLLTDTAPADAWQADQARAELADVLRGAGPAAAGVPLGIADVRALLARRLRGRPTRANFRTGTLTIATLVPMRAVPHRVVCLLGLDDGVFPRAGLPDGDDVLARDPLVGERDVRSEDRQLLLDAVCAATEHLVVLYSGADERTGARRPPAVPLGELLDALDATARTADGRPVREQILVRHPLQPFDPRNFTSGALGVPGRFSFDPAELAGALAASGAEQARIPAVAGPLPSVANGGPLPLAELVAFARHPVRAFLRQRVGLSFTDDAGALDSALPVEPDGLRSWAIGERLLRDRLAGLDPARSQAVEWRRGELPPGALGQRLLADVVADVEPLVSLSAHLREAPPDTVDVDVALPGGPHLVGTVGGVHGTVLVRVEYSRLAPKHRLRAWVELLAVSVARPEQVWQAVTIGRGTHSGLTRSTLGPVAPERAAALLADVVELHRRGMCEALPLATATSYAYAFGRSGGGSAADALARARREWERDRSGRDDPAHRLVWGSGAPYDDARFGEIAMQVWAPVFGAETLEHR